jgi:hypothetical protein
MTEHKRPRFMAAVGVSTVFLAVIAGVVGKTPFSHAANATPAASVVPAATNPILLRLSQLASPFRVFTPSELGASAKVPVL